VSVATTKIRARAKLDGMFLVVRRGETDMTDCPAHNYYKSTRAPSAHAPVQTILDLTPSNETAGIPSERG
jgi:hypothetical protein